MPKKSLEERVLKIALAPDLTSTSLEPGPAPNSSNPKAALRRCCAAWQRSFNAFMEQAPEDDRIERRFAANEAGEAYRNAMPILSGYDGVCEFLACAAHGILIGAIPPEKSGQVLYAVQIALNTLSHQPGKQPKQQAGMHSPLPPSQETLPSGHESSPTQMQ